MASPEVTVIVAVYNTMPYLTECLDSVLGQTLGRDRLELIAVDDGSTDGSAEELQRYAARYPDTVTVLRQENSGGPARPSNRALERAAGRYVFFLGADDRLGPEALERMVTTADTHGCDVVAGRITGVGGRWVRPDLYRATDLDVDLYTSTLPYALSNTKLFRRELIERHRLRFPEDMPVGSDQPFTIHALVRAARIAVLADYDYYYAVRREDAGNITYRVDQAGLMAATVRIMHTTAELLPPGRRRDALMFRHFEWDLAKCLRPGFLELDREVQELVCKGVAEVADAYLTDRIRDGLEIRRRHRIGLAQHGAVDPLRASLRGEREERDPGLVVEGERAYFAYPGFRDGAYGVPDRFFEVLAENLSSLLSRGCEVTGLGWARGRGRAPELRLALRLPLSGDAPPLHLCYGTERLPKHADRHSVHRLRPAAVRAHPADAAGGARQDVAVRGGTALVCGALPVRPGLRDAEVRLRVDLAGTTYEMAVPGGAPAVPPLRFRHRGHRYRATARANRKGRLVVGTTAAPLHRAVVRRLRAAASTAAEAAATAAVPGPEGRKNRR